MTCHRLAKEYSISKPSIQRACDNYRRFGVVTRISRLGRVRQLPEEVTDFILKDETLTKLFLTLCSLCTLVVGSTVTPYQKRDLTAAIR